MCPTCAKSHSALRCQQPQPQKRRLRKPVPIGVSGTGAPSGGRPDPAGGSPSVHWSPSASPQHGQIPLRRAGDETRTPASPGGPQRDRHGRRRSPSPATIHHGEAETQEDWHSAPPPAIRAAWFDTIEMLASRLTGDTAVGLGLSTNAAELFHYEWRPMNDGRMAPGAESQCPCTLSRECNHCCSGLLDRTPIDCIAPAAATSVSVWSSSRST